MRSYSMIPLEIMWRLLKNDCNIFLFGIIELKLKLIV